MFKVWIVDDEPRVTDGLSRQVDWEAYNMELAGIATNGQDVLDGLAVLPADLLITDISMPQMDGLTLIGRVKSLCPSIRCVIITAYNEFDFVKKALQLGVENYLLKPINDRELNDTLSKTMENLLRDRTAISQESPDVLAFRTNILDRWVNGTIQEFELEERAELLHIRLSSPWFTVCVLDIRDPFVPRDKFGDASQLLQLCRHSLPVSSGTECFIDRAFRVVAIVPESEAGQSRGELAALLFQIARETESTGMKLFSSVAPPVAGSANVSAGYQTAVFFLNHRFLDPAATTVDCRSYADEAPGGSEASQTLTLQFEKALREGQLHQALQLAAKYFDSRNAADFGSVRGGSVQLALSLIRTMIDAGRVSDALPEEIVIRLSDFSGLRSATGIKEWLERIIQMGVQVIQERKGSYHLLIHRTLEQVNRNYGSALSLKTLAIGFNVSPAYLGQLFRDETGKYFNDYVTEVRLEASISLLLESDLKINEIVTRIGIPNQSYFNRVFKKTYGVSPLEYRRQIARPAR